VSEQILNGTSAQLGYIQCHSRWKIQDRKQIENKHYKTKQNPEKQTTQNTTELNQPGLVASYDTRPGTEVGLFYNAPQPTRGNSLTTPVS